MTGRSPQAISSALIVDCSSSTSAVLLEMQEGSFRVVARGEAATTVDAPVHDVTVGVLASVRQVEEMAERRLIGDDGEGIITPRQNDREGTDVFLATSSTGGGLQMLVAGLVSIMTAESAQRAALGAGAVVMDVIAIDDGRLPHEKIQRTRELSPDMVLLSGGIDGGNIADVVDLAKQVAAAKLPQDLPVIFAGNAAARERINEILGNKSRLFMVENVRPVLEEEVLEPASTAIHQRYMEHVVANAPGFATLAGWTSDDIMPTAGAVGQLVRSYAEKQKLNVLAVNLGEATTDAISLFRRRFTRTVSGDIGWGSSVGSVLKQAGIDNIRRWLPFAVEPGVLRNRLRNKMLRPHLVPYTEDDLFIELAVCREALRLAVAHHKASVVGLRGIQRVKDISMIFDQTDPKASLLDMLRLDMIIGSGVPFAQVTHPSQAALMLLDGLRPEGVTTLAVDGQSLMPHLGVLSSKLPEVAVDVLQEGGLTILATVISPVGEAEIGEPCLSLEVQSGSGVTVKDFAFGELAVIPLTELAEVRLRPATNFDVGGGKGRQVEITAPAAPCGIIVDARPKDLFSNTGSSVERQRQLHEWQAALVQEGGR